MEKENIHIQHRGKKYTEDKEYETAVSVSKNERYTFCDVCGRKHKENQGIKISYDFTDTCGAGNWNVCENCEKKVVKKLRKLLKALNGD